MRTLYSVALCAGAAVLPAVARAQPQVEPLTITASRLTEPLTVTPGAYVVTDLQIQRRGAPYVADVLAEVPGVSISENGAFGGVSILRLRGASGDKTLVLVDGVPVNDPTEPAGGFDFSSLDAANVQRIEILTGPQSSLWGSDAIGGVVSISTREPQGLALSAEGGSLATLRSASSIGRSTERYAFGLAVSTFRTEGVSKADRKDGNAEPDGFNTSTVSANLRLTLNDRFSLDARARTNAAATEFDGFGGPTGVIDSSDGSDARVASGYVRVKAKDLFGFDHTVRADLMDLDRQYHGAFDYGAKGGQQVVRWQGERNRPLYGLALGAERTSQQANTGDGRETRDMTGYFAIGRLGPVAALTLTASVRRDEVQRRLGQTTGRLALAWQAGGGFTIKGSWGQGFKAPSIFETTYPCFECAVPGPNMHLRPERAEGWDGGLAWSKGPISVQATWFDLRTRDQIDYLFGSGYANIARVRSTGVEAEGAVDLPLGFAAHASYTHDDAVDGVGVRLLKVPRDVGSGALAWSRGAWSTDLGVRAQAAAPDVYGTIKPFAVAYATALYALPHDLTLTARIENLANAHYQQAFGYGEPGRMVLVGLRWRVG